MAVLSVQYKLFPYCKFQIAVTSTFFLLAEKENIIHYTKNTFTNHSSKQQYNNHIKL